MNQHNYSHGFKLATRETAHRYVEGRQVPSYDYVGNVRGIRWILIDATPAKSCANGLMAYAVK